VSSDRFATLRDVYGRAVARAPACRRIFEQAGLAPADLRSGADLARIPVFKKEWLLDAQRREPPFGGFLGEDASRVKRIYVSPGPILEPQFHGDRGGHGFDAAFGAAGLGPGGSSAAWGWARVVEGVREGDAVALTVEPAAGSEAPTTTPVVVRDSRSTAHAMPKSVTFTSPWHETRRFCGERSRCNTGHGSPAASQSECAAWTPRAAS
jgi:hypothetical protein